MSDCRKCEKFEECAADEDCGLFKPKPLTNADYIRSMTDYDLADWIAKVLMYHGIVQWHPHLDCDKNCPLYECCNNQPTDNIEGWLKSLAREGSGCMKP